MKYNTIIFLSFAALLLSGISYTFWHYTLKDFLPTPMPKNYEARAVADQIALGPHGLKESSKPTLYHFFNPDCPCSRFNLEHIHWLIENYSAQIAIRVVLQVEDSTYNWQELEQDLGLGVPYIVDYNGELSKACGIYATPQAAVLTAENTLYYRGNYNRAKYCTDPRTSYAQQAIDSLLANKPPPMMGVTATQSYGCQLPQKTFIYE